MTKPTLGARIAAMNPGELLELWTQMASMVNAVHAQAPARKAHGPRALKRRARRRRSEAKLLRARRIGFRSFGELEKMGRQAYDAREARYAAARVARAARS